MIHHVFANRSNAGDWLSARGIQNLIGHGPFAEHLCDEPFVPQTLDSLRRLGAGDLVVVGGGGLFMSYFAPFWRGMVPIMEDVPVVLWGVGACDHKSGSSLLPQHLLGDVVARARFVAVRDALTRSLIGGAAPVTVVPCPSLAALEPAPAAGRGLLLVVHLDLLGDEGYRRLGDAATAFAEATGRARRETNLRIDPGSAAGLDRVIALYRASDFVLSSRLHGCILAVALGLPVLAVSGDRKIEAFMEAMGLGDWVVDPADVAQVEDRLRGLDAQPSPAAMVRSARSANREVAERVHALYRGSLGGRAP